MSSKKVKHRILLIDDDQGIRSEIGGMLQDLGYEVKTSADGNEALNIIQKEDFDVYITDIKMPEKDGLTLLKETKKVKPDAYFIMITGFGDEEKAIDCLNFGAFSYLRKPITNTEIKVSIERCLDRQKLINNIKQIEGIKLAVQNFEDQVNNPLHTISLCADYLLTLSNKIAKEEQSFDLKAFEKSLEIIIKNVERIAKHIKQLNKIEKIKLVDTTVGPLLDVIYPYEKKSRKKKS